MLDYTLNGKVGLLNNEELAILVKYPPSIKKDWAKPQYDVIKKRLKSELYIGQFDKCAYCRQVVEADARYEPLDHIVAQSIKPQWMLEPKNLVVTCNSCNNLKNDENTLAPGYEDVTNLPDSSEAYLIFNPHYDNWEQHLCYEDDLFITPVANSKGATTIRICQLFRYNVIINRAKEVKLGQKQPLQKMLARLATLSDGTQEVAQIKSELYNAMGYFIQRMEEKTGYN